MKEQDKEKFKKMFGKHLAALRKENNLSQEQLAFNADIDLSTVSRLERGILNATMDTLFQIAKALNIPIKELFDF